MKKFNKAVVFLLLLTSCINSGNVKQARSMSDKLLTDISKGNANEDFPVKYFPRVKTEQLVNELKNNCDFVHRKGRFINDFTQVSPKYKKVSFIYEYYLRCDSVRLILTYNLGKKIELINFKLEPIENDNIMITKPKRRLKY